MRNTRVVKSNVILRSDLLNVLDAVVRANDRVSRLASAPQLGEYAEGFRAAIETVAAAFDLDIEERGNQGKEPMVVSYETDRGRLIADAHAY